MKPVSHPSNTRTLQAPVGWDQSGLPVEPLGITDQYVEGVHCVWSFWRPDAEELAALNAGGHVVLSIVGRTMPPAALMVTVPEQDQQPAEQESRRPENCGTSYCSCIECIADQGAAGSPETWTNIREALQAVIDDGVCAELDELDCQLLLDLIASRGGAA